MMSLARQKQRQHNVGYRQYNNVRMIHYDVALNDTTLFSIGLDDKAKLTAQVQRLQLEANQLHDKAAANV